MERRTSLSTCTILFERSFHDCDISADHQLPRANAFEASVFFDRVAPGYRHQRNSGGHSHSGRAAGRLCALPTAAKSARRFMSEPMKTKGGCRPSRVAELGKMDCRRISSGTASPPPWPWLSICRARDGSRQRFSFEVGGPASVFVSPSPDSHHALCPTVPFSPIR